MLNECNILARGLPLRASESGGGVNHYRGDPAVKFQNQAGRRLPWVGGPRQWRSVLGGGGEVLLGRQPGLYRFWE